MDKAATIRALKEAAYIRKNCPKASPKKRSVVSKLLDKVKGITMTQWFSLRREEMTGQCQCGCGRPSCKHEDQYFKFSIAHILPKRLFPSVATHPLNWIEMNFWDGCHTNMDNRSMDLWVNMECWPLIVARFRVLAPLLTDKEKATKFYKQLLALILSNQK